MDIAPFRREVLSQLSQRAIGTNLSALARDFSITVVKNGKVNKGWVGQTLERLASLENSSLAAPDGADFELKSTKVSHQNGQWVFKETIKVTNLNPEQILEEDFEQSILWRKLSRLIVVGCEYASPTEARAVFLAAVDLNDPELIGPVRSFWEDVKYLVASGEMPDHINVGSFQDFLQLRPTGDGKGTSVCPVTGRPFPARAFYATKKFLNRLVPAWV